MAPWFTRALLYWDEVGVIVPYNFIEDPETLDKSTLSLVKSGLLTQVVPGFYIWEIPNFKESFLNYLESLGPELDLRQQSFENKSQVVDTYIHIEKLDSLADELWKLKLAGKPDRGPFSRNEWVQIEKTTGQDFMCYLASTLGRVESLGYRPFANDSECKQRFIDANTPRDQVETNVRPIRDIILSDLLPAPALAQNADEIQRFKDIHGDDLRRFRIRIEREIVQLADMANDSLRARQLELFLLEAKEEIDNLVAKMADFGWVHTSLTTVTAIVSAVPGTSPMIGIANAVLNAFGKPNTDTSSPFLYSALAQTEFESDSAS